MAKSIAREGKAAVRICRSGVKQRLLALPFKEAPGAAIQARELLLRRCRSCGGCWLRLL